MNLECIQFLFPIFLRFCKDSAVIVTAEFVPDPKFRTQKSKVNFLAAKRSSDLNSKVNLVSCYLDK